jgi:hypothetical protein
MEPRGSLPYSQEPTSGPYPKPNYFIPHPQTLFILILTTDLCQKFPSGRFLSGFSTRTLLHILQIDIFIAGSNVL